MSSNKEAAQVRRATDDRIISSRQTFAEHFNVVYQAGKGTFRKRKVFACSCSMCRGMVKWKHEARHRTPKERRALAFAKDSLRELD